jgi:long-chain acyl-CoA synthetase
MRRQTLVEYVDRFYALGSQTAYLHPRGYRMSRWTYREIADSAHGFARRLAGLNIHKADRVLIWGDNCAEWVAAFLGCVLQGVVVVPMDRIASPDFALRVARQVDAKLVVCSGTQPELDPALPRLFFERLAEPPAQDSRPPYSRPDLRRDDPVQIVFTSGTTAEPKGVVISHGNILANLEPLETEIQKYLKYERIFHPIRFLNLLPLSHVFGQFLGIFVPHLLQGIVVFQESLNPSEVIRVIKRERISVLVAVPRILETLKEKIELDFEAKGTLDRFRKELETAKGEHFIKRWWRFRRVHGRFGWKFWAFVSGGAALDLETEVFWARLGFAVIQGYGLTETTSLVSVNHPFKLGRGSIGKVLPGREIRLDESGEILVRGENIAAGYWQGTELRPGLGQEGWFHTGDMGELDAQGNLYFKGRKKNVIVTPEGMNVYPEDLEAALRGQPEVRDCVVVGIAREGNAEPCAVLILAEGVKDVKNVVTRANESLAEYQHIRRWFVWPEEDFPRTSTQKPRTSVIQQKVQAQIAGESRSRPGSSTLVDLIERVTGRAPVDTSEHANLEADLNLNSLDRVALMSAIEDRYQVDLNETRFTSATTLGELDQMLRERGPRRSDYSFPRWTQRWPVTWIRLAVYYLLVWPATMLMARPRIFGREQLGGVKGPVLIVANHIASVDIGFILAALPGRLRHRLAVAMEGERLQAMRRPPLQLSSFRRWLRKLNYGLVVALFNVFPLPQQTGFRESFAFAGESIDRGFSLLVFPEGRRTEDGAMAPFRAGIGLLVKNLGVPVVPIRIDGLFELKQAGRKVAPPGAVKVTMGPPAHFDAKDDPTAIASELQNRVALLGNLQADSL